MTDATDASRATLEAELRRAAQSERQRLLALCRDLIRTPSENPPGDTRAAARLVEDVLRDADVAHEVIAPDATMPNVVATIGEGGANLVMNAHLDTFPVGDREPWTVDPFGGEIRDGFIYGRGAADMRGGLAAIVMAFAVLARSRRELGGRVTLVIVSDEETFGAFGAAHVLEHVPGTTGDAYLGAEPSGTGLLRCGEKGLCWMRVRVRTTGAHGAMLHHSSNAIRELASVIEDLDRLAALPVAMPPRASALIETAAPAVDAELGAGMTELIRRPTVNVGTISGGAKVNMVAGEAHAEIDVRLPLGVELEAAIREAERTVASHPGATLEVLKAAPPTFSDPDDPIFVAMRGAATAVRGSEPITCVAAPATDARLWRQRGVPAAIYGPKPYRLGGVDEHISVQDLYDVSETHAVAAARYLAGVAARR